MRKHVWIMNHYARKDRMMSKRMLMVATVPSMIGLFNMDNIHILLDIGYEVDVASDFTDTSVWPIERVQNFKEQMAGLGIECIQIDFSRSPLKINKHMDSYKELVRLIRDRQYSFIHTHTPIASAIARLAAHTTGTKVIYTAHGFHFYKGAPLKNWLLYYPIEWLCSFWTDILITINHEDYERAKKHFHAKEAVYVPGVGIDTEKFRPEENEREKIRTEIGPNESQTRSTDELNGNQSNFNWQEKRKEIGIPLDAKLLISVGELSIRKNHMVMVEALQRLPKDYWYVIVGKGALKDELSAHDHTGRLRLLGYRTDVVELLRVSDLFVFPSLQEGLPVALMEAMAAGLPVVTTAIRGITDLLKGSKNIMIEKMDYPNAFADAVTELMCDCDRYVCCSNDNYKRAIEYDNAKISRIMVDIYNCLC